MDKRPSEPHPELFSADYGTVCHKVAEETAPTTKNGKAEPSPLDEWCGRVSPATKAKILRMVRSSGMGDNDPLVASCACLQLEHDEIRAELGALVLSAARKIDELMSAETGATKYAARLHEIMEETRTAVEVADTYLKVLVKLKETGSEVLQATLRPLLTKLLWKTAAIVIAADLVLRLLFAHLP